MNKYQKLAEIFSKNLVNHGLYVYHPSNNGHVMTKAPNDQVSKIVSKVTQEDLRKNIYLLHLQGFFENFSTVRRFDTTPRCRSNS